MDIRKCTGYDTFIAAEPFIIVIVQTHHLASTEYPLVDANVVMERIIL